MVQDAKGSSVTFVQPQTLKRAEFGMHSMLEKVRAMRSGRKRGLGKDSPR